MKAQREALVQWLRDQLPGWNISDRQRVVRHGASRLYQASVMGDPIRYVEVAYDPVFESDYQSEWRRREVRHYQFVLYIYLQYEDAETLDASSQAEWEELLEGTPGLLRQLASVVQVSYAGTTYLIFPVSVETQLVALDEAGRQVVHFAELRVRVR